MTRSRIVAAIVVLAVAGLAIYYFATPACACLTPDQAARGRTKSEMRQILGALQTWRDEHGRYPATLEELNFPIGTTVSAPG